MRAATPSSWFRRRPEIQRARAFERPGMTEEKFAALLAKQMPDAEKRRRADFIVDSSQGFDHARAQVRDILQAVAKMPRRRSDSRRRRKRPAGKAYARNRARHRNHRARSLSGRSPGRDRLHRAGQPLSDRQDVPLLLQSGTRHAGSGVRRFTACPIEFLKDKPLFAEKVDELIAFLGDAPLVAHNAMFDLGFLNAELERAGRAAGRRERMVDTLLHRPPQASRRRQSARRSVRALCDRQFAPHQARRAARCRASGRSLCRVDRRPSGAARSVAGRSASAGVPASRSSCASARRRLPRGYRTRNAPRTARFVATLGDSAIWRDYLSLD